jgi:Domain of unknown function (DUF1883)
MARNRSDQQGAVMKFRYAQLGHQERGTVVEIQLAGSNTANVMLLDSTNFSNYKSRRSCRYTGGRVNRTPVRLQVPHSGTWYAVADLGGHAGSLGMSTTVLP